jgi:hypothetical protein
MQNNVDVKVYDTTAQKIKDALARFAEPLESSEDSDETTTATDSDEYDEKDDGTKERKVVVTLPAMNSDDDSEGEDDEEGGDGTSAEEDIFSDIKRVEFDNDMNDLLRHMAASKQKPPESFKKPPPSFKKQVPAPVAPASSKKRGRKSV